MRRKNWTKDEESLLIENYSHKPLREIAKALDRHESTVCVKAKKLGLQSKKSKLMIEQFALKKKGKRRCYKCKQIMDNTKEIFGNNRRGCNKCSKEISLIKYYHLKQSPDYVSVLKSRLSAAKSRAKKKNVPFNIELKDLLEVYKSQDEKCYYTKLPLKSKIESYYDNKEVLSIDRINPSLGYTKGNIALCCDCVNTMKNRMSVSEFKYYINLLHINIPNVD